MKTLCSITQLAGLFLIIYGLFQPSLFFYNYLIFGLLFLIGGGFIHRYYSKKEKEIKESKKCLHCAEYIKKEAKICKHCKEKIAE